MNLIYKYENFIKSINEEYEYDTSGKYTKLIDVSPKTSIDMSDVDPYGEEDWNEHVNEIDWDKIKIVHPTKDDIGKKVLIIKGTRYYSENPHNPSDVIGIIDNYYPEELDENEIGVLWSNREHNSYTSEDLAIIEFIKK